MDNPGSPRRTIAEQIQDALWLCISPRRNALDEEKIQLQNDLKKIIRERNLPKFKEVLALMGKGENTKEGQYLIGEFKNLSLFD